MPDCSHINCRSINVESNFTHKVNYGYFVVFQARNLRIYLKAQDSFPTQGRGNGRIHKITYFLEHYTGRMKANVITSEVNAIMHVVLRRAEKHMSCRDLVVTRKFIKP